jgi:hypothetical protein
VYKKGNNVSAETHSSLVQLSSPFAGLQCVFVRSWFKGNVLVMEKSECACGRRNQDGLGSVV